MNINQDAITVRELTDDDRSLLLEWLLNPKVLEFYEGRDATFDLEEIDREFYQDDELTRCIIEFDKKPIGYIQFYKVEDEYKQKYGFVSDHTYGLDQFIGEIEYWNQGIGTKLVKLMANYLVEQKGAEHVVMDPQVSNKRAIRAYEKSGFEIIKKLPKHEWHEGEYRDCWLMEFKYEIR
ncbi:GNAT family N-acetyltransferase [Aquisalibacillus elongatus]|uniref:Aminoglycoside 6'-N-acetyltransferase n=1 Tax=Aquisalibacillus elongatus TaxID=485577 RepID=A0A3N5B7J2_9BACI|nr:GNAT family N-acetyltransferase [Aquisalibacillus elongatus]RPF53313.1 aminoglycoside 6'-N-acetyltransferase [Aquisalibacillus elongatus]